MDTSGKNFAHISVVSLELNLRISESLPNSKNKWTSTLKREWGRTLKDTKPPKLIGFLVFLENERQPNLRKGETGAPGDGMRVQIPIQRKPKEWRWEGNFCSLWIKQVIMPSML
ncbi:unnamed protein product [Allacma fusca]|uniref:Uncharacterized protein n=1 Tax=Allacma fusca TaxID=39272 RepID=A0A8J2JRD0_9HEXA|nr:unnamed protein product [Allacma fusca]